MSVVKIEKELAEIINSKETIKVLATNDKSGIPHAVFKGSIHVNEDGNIEFWELLESSQTQQNLVAGIWFNKLVAVSVLGRDKKSYQIKGYPVECIDSGRYFEKVYKEAQELLGDVDLGAVWIIEPEEIREETFKKRQQEDEGKYPILKHLDRLAKK